MYYIPQSFSGGGRRGDSPPPPMIFTKTVMDARLSGRFALVFILSFDCGSVRVQIKTKIKTNLFEGLFINLKIFKMLRKSKFFEIIFYC